MGPSEAVSLALAGLPLGAMYSLQAMGIVLVYKTSQVFNFAQGAIGMAAAYAASYLGISLGLPTIVAVVGAVLLGAVLGVLIELTTIRPIKGQLQRTVATLGWLLGIQGAVEVLAGSSAGRAFLTPVPQDPLINISSPIFVSYAKDQLFVMGIAVAIAVVLGIFFRIHPFGVSMRAVADAPEGARLLGINVNRVTLVSWAVGAGMAALSGVLVTPLLASLDTVSLVIFTIQALAAALVGRLESLPMTFAGGLVLGMSQPVLNRLFNLGAGAEEFVALLFVLGALLLRKRTGRGDSGAGGLAPVALRPMPRGPAARAGLLALLVVGAAVLVVVDPLGIGSRDVASTMAWSLGVLSLVLLAGVAGQVSLCQGVFMAVGGYGAAIALQAGIPFLATLLIGAVLAAGVAAVIGLPALRLRGLELAIVTLSLAFAADRYFFKTFKPLIGPDTTRSFPRPDYADQLVERTTASGTVITVTDWRPYAFIALVLFLAAAWGVASLRRGRTGAAFTALRSSEAATSAMGFSVVGVKLRGFALSGFVAGLGGALYAGLTEVATSSAFGFDRSITLLAYTVIAGMGSVPGAVVGGLIVTLSAASFGGGEGQVASSSDAVVTVVTGIVLIAVLIFAPRGLAGAGGNLRARLRRGGRDGGADGGEPEVDAADLDDPTRELEGV